MYFTAPAYYFRFSSAFMQQRSGLQRALPAANYQHLFPRKLREVTMLGRVRHQARRKAVEVCGSPGK